ncbi:MAG TPA: carboxypeptidase-like regulatory domain-containing protein [Verrucomicrobiae bacterium]|nr:carboxypeptidase-like regulatory domain-containing protein [Verrucomicrobiae bacterium]
MKALLRFALVPALVAAFLAGCNNDDLPPSAGYATLQGTILDHATNKPIAGALVTVDTVLTATTDDTGTFKVDRVPSGIVDYTVQAKGYTLVEASTNAEPGKVSSLSLTLDAQPAAGS